MYDTKFKQQLHACMFTRQYIKVMPVHIFFSYRKLTKYTEHSFQQALINQPTAVCMYIDTSRHSLILTRFSRMIVQGKQRYEHNSTKIREPQDSQGVQ